MELPTRPVLRGTARSPSACPGHRADPLPPRAELCHLTASASRLFRTDCAASTEATNKELKTLALRESASQNTGSLLTTLSERLPPNQTLGNELPARNECKCNSDSLFYK